MVTIAGVRSELKKLSKNQLKKLRADIREELRTGMQIWDRIFPDCDNCDECIVEKTCNYILIEANSYPETANKTLHEIRLELARR